MAGGGLKVLRSLVPLILQVINFMGTNIVHEALLSIQLLLPYCENFLEKAGWGELGALTTNRISSVHTSAVFFDKDRFRFYWSANPTNRFMGRLGQFTDRANSYRGLNPDADLSLLEDHDNRFGEPEALAVAQQFLMRLGYDEKRLQWSQ